jgi:hypothetical protein
MRLHHTAPQRLKHSFVHSSAPGAMKLSPNETKAEGSAPHFHPDDGCSTFSLSRLHAYSITVLLYSSDVL